MIGVGLPLNKAPYLIGDGITPLYNGVNVIYSLRRPSMSNLWTNAVLQLRRDSDNQTAFVFFDGNEVNDTITLNSLISTTSNTTPSATTLGAWVGSGLASVRQWIGITDDNTIDANKTISQTSSTTLQPVFVSAGAILLKEGQPYTNYSSLAQFLRGTTNPVFNEANDFTVIIKSFSFINSDVQTVLTTGLTALDRFSAFNDRTTDRRSGLIRNTTPTNYIATLISQLDTNAIRNQTIVKEGNNLSTYLEDVLQSTVTYTGTYTNETFTLGMDVNSQTPLQGGILEVIVWASAVAPS